MTVPARFLNVDLDLHDRAGVDALVTALEPKMFVLHKGERFASLELATGTTPPMEKVLNRIVDVVEALPLRARKLWNRCQRRTINLGFEAGDAHPSKGFVIAATTLQRLGRIGEEIEVTIYAHQPRLQSSLKRSR